MCPFNNFSFCFGPKYYLAYRSFEINNYRRSNEITLSEKSLETDEKAYFAASACNAALGVEYATDMQEVRLRSFIRRNLKFTISAPLLYLNKKGKMSSNGGKSELPQIWFHCNRGVKSRHSQEFR